MLVGLRQKYVPVVESGPRVELPIYQLHIINAVSFQQWCNYI